MELSDYCLRKNSHIYSFALALAFINREPGSRNQRWWGANGFAGALAFVNHEPGSHNQRWWTIDSFAGALAVIRGAHRKVRCTNEQLAIREKCNRYAGQTT